MVLCCVRSDLRNLHWAGKLWGERVKRLRVEFLMKYGRKEKGCWQSSWVVDSADMDTCRQANRAIDNRYLELSTVFYKEWILSEFVFCCQQPDSVLLLGESEMVSEFFLIQIQNFDFSFFSGLHAYVTRGYSSCYCIMYLIDLIRSLSPSAPRT